MSLYSVNRVIVRRTVACSCVCNFNGLHSPAELASVSLLLLLFSRVVCRSVIADCRGDTSWVYARDLVNWREYARVRESRWEFVWIRDSSCEFARVRESRWAFSRDYASSRDIVWVHKSSREGIEKRVRERVHEISRELGRLPRPPVIHLNRCIPEWSH